jgi:hypothetical protein
MADALDDLLKLVAEGRLSPEEAAPIIEALAGARTAADRARARGDEARSAGRAVRDRVRGTRFAAFAAAAGPAPARHATPGIPSAGLPRRLRIQVRDEGRTVVDLQLPGILAELAGAVPGIPAAYADRVREALRTGLRGPVVDVTDEDGSGVTITID